MDDVFLIQAIHLGYGHWHCQQIRNIILTKEISLKKSIVFVLKHIFEAVIKDVTAHSAVIILQNIIMLGMPVRTQRAEYHWPILRSKQS